MFYYQDAKIISDNIENLDTIVINGNTGDFVTGGHPNKNSDELADLDLEQELQHLQTMAKRRLRTRFTEIYSQINSWRSNINVRPR